MLNLLNQLEQELKRLNMDCPRPNAEALASREPFCIDTMTFSAWLQWVYLPQMRLILQHQQPIPRAHLLPIAEEAWRGCPDTAKLLQLISALDSTHQKETS